MIPARPRLGDHVRARRHFTDGVEKIVLHDAATGALVMLDERALAIALAADGTRDVGGIVLAVARAGLLERRSVVSAVLEDLSTAGLLADGIAASFQPSGAPQTTLTPLSGASRARPLVRLPDYAFHCTGKGGCCVQYGTLALTEADVVRARRAGLATLPGDDDERRVLLPLFGVHDRGRSAMTLVDGACLQRTEAGRCGLHERGGASAKPIACATYPATFVDDGVELRASVSLECACVFESVGAEEAVSLMPESWATSADLMPGIAVRVLPPRVALTAERDAPCEEVSAWSRALGDVDWLAGEVDPAAVALALAAHVSAHGLDSGARAAVADAAALDVATLLPRISAHAELFASAATSSASWRSEKDRTRRMRETLAVVASRIAGSEALASSVAAEVAFRESERLALRAALFGHGLVGRASMADGLVDLASRFFIARALGQTDLGHPLAVVMATLGGT